MSQQIKCGTSEHCGNCLVGNLPDGKKKEAVIQAISIIATDAYKNGVVSVMIGQAKSIYTYYAGYSVEPDQFEAAIDASVVRIAEQDPKCIAEPNTCP